MQLFYAPPQSKDMADFIWIKYAVCYAELLQLCQSLGGPLHCSRPGSSVHGIFQARMLEWVAMPFSR